MSEKKGLNLGEKIKNIIRLEKRPGKEDSN